MLRQRFARRRQANRLSSPTCPRERRDPANAATLTHDGARAQTTRLLPLPKPPSKPRSFRAVRNAG
jgi:hypothetical protein